MSDIPMPVRYKGMTDKEILDHISFILKQDEDLEIKGARIQTLVKYNYGNYIEVYPQAIDRPNDEA